MAGRVTGNDYSGRLLVLFLFFLLRIGEILSIHGNEPFIGCAVKHRDCICLIATPVRSRSELSNSGTAAQSRSLASAECRMMFAAFSCPSAN